MKEARQLLQRFINMYRENSPIGTLETLVKDVDEYLAKPLPEPVGFTDSESIRMVKEHNVSGYFYQVYDSPTYNIPLYAEPPALTNEERSRLKTLERICEGLTQDHIDGGFTVTGLSRYAKKP